MRLLSNPFPDRMQSGGRQLRRPTASTNTPDATFHMVSLLTNKVPPEGTLRRCTHGIYSPSWVNGVNYYCQMCNSSREIPNAQEVHLPRSSGDRLTTDGVIQANKRAGSACPACGSYVWMRSKEDGPDTRRECAECGTAYSVRLSVHHQVEQMLAEMQAE